MTATHCARQGLSELQLGSSKKLTKPPDHKFGLKAGFGKFFTDFLAVR